MKIYRIAQSKWRQKSDREYNRIQSRMQPFLDEHPEFAEAYKKSLEKGPDGFSFEDKDRKLMSIGRNFKKFFNLTDNQIRAYIDKVREMEQEALGD